MKKRVKIVLIGDSNVGKTSILYRIQYQRLDEPMIDPTIGVSLSRIINRDTDLFIWDTAGMERFHSLTVSFYRETQGIILVFDVTHRKSYDHIGRWMEDIIQNCLNLPKILLVANKSDQPEMFWQVNYSEILTISEFYNLPFIVVSAKTGENVDTILPTLLHQIEPIQMEMDNPVPIKKKCCI